MEIQKALESLSRYTDSGILKKLFDTCTNYAPEEINSLIPSIVLGAEGLVGKSIVMVTKNYLGESNLDPNNHIFDFVKKDTVDNHRFRIWTHTVMDNEVEKNKYYLAEITLRHSAFSLNTQLAFTADSEEITKNWIRDVLKELPIKY